MRALHGARREEIELEIIEAHLPRLPNLPIDPFQRGRVRDIECVPFLLDRNRPALFVAQRDLRKGQTGLINRLRQRIFAAPGPANEWAQIKAGKLAVVVNMLGGLAKLISGKVVAVNIYVAA